MWEWVNYVNVFIEVKEWGIWVVEIRDGLVWDYSGLLYLEVKGFLGEYNVWGVLLGKDEIWIINIDGFLINVFFSLYMLLIFYWDMLGIIGKIGLFLGSFNVNIVSM